MHGAARQAGERAILAVDAGLRQGAPPACPAVRPTVFGFLARACPRGASQSLAPDDSDLGASDLGAETRPGAVVALAKTGKQIGVRIPMMRLREKLDLAPAEETGFLTVRDGHRHSCDAGRKAPVSALDGAAVLVTVCRYAHNEPE